VETKREHHCFPKCFCLCFFFFFSLSCFLLPFPESKRDGGKSDQGLFDGVRGRIIEQIEGVLVRFGGYQVGGEKGLLLLLVGLERGSVVGMRGTEGGDV